MSQEKEILSTKTDKVKNTKKAGCLKGCLIPLLFILALMVIIGSCSSDESDTNDTEKAEEATPVAPEETPEEKAAREAKEKAEEESKVKAEAERLAKLEALKLSGNGDSVSNTFTLDKGFVVVNATHSGSRNFAVLLYNSEGERIELLVNTIGNYNGSQAILIPAGQYKYEVTASGPWSINMSQYIPDNVLPQGTATGSGDSVVFMQLEKGSYTVSATHDGSRNFAVKANDSALLFNEIGHYSGQIMQKVEDTSIYFLNVNADGNWSISFE